VADKDPRFDWYDACMRQAELAYQSFNDRRQTEWKVAFGLWTLVIVAILYMPADLPWYGRTLGALLIYGVYSCWLRGVWKANEQDKQRRDHFRDNAEMFLINATHPIKETFTIKSSELDIKKFLSDWSTKSHLAATFVLLLAFVLLAGRMTQNPGRHPQETDAEELRILAAATARSSAQASQSAAEAARLALEVVRMTPKPSPQPKGRGTVHNPGAP